MSEGIGQAKHRPALVVSLHDVSPLTQAACVDILDRLQAIGVARCSLLVIPDHHHKGHFLGNPAFCDWLTQLAGQGHEIVVHGYFHQRERRAGENLGQKLLTRVYTADESEFFDVAADTAEQLYQRALEEFQKIGLKPRGFIAPAWLLGAAAEGALRKAGCQYTTRLGAVSSFAHGRVYQSQSLVWSVRSLWRRVVSLAWNRWLFGRLQSNPLLRISLHPVDIAYGKVWKQAECLIRQALAGREPVTYEQWVEGNLNT